MGKGLGSGQVVQLGKGWGVRHNALGMISLGVGLMMCSSCRAQGTTASRLWYRDPAQLKGWARFSSGC